jgi:hypothetical protein
MLTLKTISDIWIASVSIFIGIVGIIIGIISRTRIELNYIHRNFPEILKLSDTNRKINVLYNNTTVSRVTTTKILLWNSGRKPLLKTDVPESDPIRIKFSEEGEDIFILDFRTISATQISSDFKLVSSDRKDMVIIEFNYLDSKDAVILEIQHTGSGSANVELEGVVLGPKRRTLDLSSSKFYHIKKMSFDIFSTVYLIIGLVAGYFLFLLPNAYNKEIRAFPEKMGKAVAEGFNSGDLSDEDIIKVLKFIGYPQLSGKSEFDEMFKNLKEDPKLEPFKEIILHNFAANMLLENSKFKGYKILFLFIPAGIIHIFLILYLQPPRKIYRYCGVKFFHHPNDLLSKLNNNI